MHDALQADVVVIGAGLAGLAAACEAAEAGRRVIVLDQEPEQSLGGQAHWSLGGIFLVDSREQRRLGVTDSLDLARSDWFGSIAEEAGARVINGDRMWHYTEGLRNWNPVWHNHAFAFCRGRRRWGWTPVATGCRPPATRASTRWAPWRVRQLQLARLGFEGVLGQGEDEHAALSDVAQDGGPPRLPARQVLVEPDLISATLKAGHQCPYSVTVRAGM